MLIKGVEGNFMKKFEDINTGFTVVVTKEKVKIEMPINSLINIFESSYDNDGEKVIRSKKAEFAEWIARNLLDDADSEKGDNYIVEMLDRLFEIAYEDYLDFIDYPDEHEMDKWQKESEVKKNDASRNNPLL